MLEKKNEFNAVNYRDKLQLKDVLCLENSDRNDDWISKTPTVKLLKIPSDHGFIDKRIEMIESILKWLKTE